MTFHKGESGNPAGRQRGSRNRTTILMQSLLEADGEALARKAIDLAKGGDLAALRMCMDRLVPARKPHHRRRDHAQARALSGQRDGGAKTPLRAASPFIPAKAGIQGRSLWLWVPAFAGTNGRESRGNLRHYSAGRVVGGARMT